MSPDDLGRSDLEALAAARSELGRAYEPELLESFAERVEQAIDVRVARELEDRRHDRALADRHQKQQLALAIVSVLACIPLAIPLALNDQLAALVVALLAIAAVNASFASLGNRGRR